MVESQKNATLSDDKERKEVKDDTTMIYAMMKDMFEYREEGNRMIAM